LLWLYILTLMGTNAIVLFSRRFFADAAVARRSTRALLILAFAVPSALSPAVDVPSMLGAKVEGLLPGYYVWVLSIVIALVAILVGPRTDRRVASVLAFLILVCPGALSAQGTSHGYVSVGAGATNLNGGLDWVIMDGPIGVGAEVGAGWAFLAAITGSYHVLARRSETHDLFATVGYARLGSSEFSAQGVTVGGGATYWPAARLGLRFDAFRFLAVATDNNVPAEARSPSRYWGVRTGVAFRFR
jgi:hypothetical protein